MKRSGHRLVELERLLATRQATTRPDIRGTLLAKLDTLREKHLDSVEQGHAVPVEQMSWALRLALGDAAALDWLDARLAELRQ